MSAKRVLVAGASGGIGRELVGRLAGAGTAVGAHAFQHPERVEGCGRLERFTGDLSSEAAASLLVEEFVGWAGGIDALVQLSGGISRPAGLYELTERDWARDLAVNLTGPFFLARAAMERMRGQGGRIVLTSTASARHGGGANSVGYGAAKAGVEFLTRSLAKAGARDGILVNCIAPGFIDTPFHTERMGRTAEDLEGRARLVPVGRAGTPAEAAETILFLLSEGASYITGECIAVSGGDWL